MFVLVLPGALTSCHPSGCRARHHSACCTSRRPSGQCRGCPQWPGPPALSSLRTAWWAGWTAASAGYNIVQYTYTTASTGNTFQDTLKYRYIKRWFLVLTWAGKWLCVWGPRPSCVAVSLSPSPPALTGWSYVAVGYEYSWARRRVAGCVLWTVEWTAPEIGKDIWQ